MFREVIMLIGGVNGINDHTGELQKLSLGEVSFPRTGDFE